jgi:hypothetical protein
VLAQLQGTDVGATARIGGGSGGGEVGGGQAAGAGAAAEGGFKYRGAQGLDPEFIKKLEEQFGFDKPAHERFFLMLKSYAMFDFGQSYFRDVPVLQLIKEKLPVSISLGLWLTFVSYAISIPLGVAKAVRDGSQVRRVDLCRDHCRLRDPVVPVRGVAGGAVCRRLVLEHLPAQGAGIGQFCRPQLVGKDYRLRLASGSCRSPHWRYRHLPP